MLWSDERHWDRSRRGSGMCAPVNAFPVAKTRSARWSRFDARTAPPLPLLAKAAVIVARSGLDQYRVWVRASFARYLAMWLMDASVEYR